MPTCPGSSVAITPQARFLVKASVPASRRTAGLVRLWPQPPVSLPSALKEQSHKLTMLIQEKLIGNIWVHCQSNTESCSNRQMAGVSLWEEHQCLGFNNQIQAAIVMQTNELIVRCRILCDHLCAKEKYACAIALAMNSLILKMVAKAST